MKHTTIGDLTMASERTILDDILEAYVASEAGPSRTTLTEWVRRYPEYQQQLTEFTARWGMLRWLPNKPDDKEIDEEMLVLRGMSTVQSVLFRQRRMSDQMRAQDRTVEQHSTPVHFIPIEVERPIAGLLSEGKRLSLTADDLADRVGVSDGILRKLDRRLINPTSIPALIIRDLGHVLGRDVGQITAYAQLAPRFATGAQHRANQAPTLPAVQEDFFDAVRHDLTLSEESRARLLSLAPPQERSE